MLRKYLSLFLVFCFIVVLAACGSSNQSSSSTADTSSTPAGSSTAATEPAEKPVLKVIMIDYGNIKDTPDEKMVLDWVGEKIGAEIKPILLPTSTEVDTKIALKFAANEDFDIYPEFMQGKNQGAATKKFKAGQIISLSPYIDQYAPNMKNPDLLPEDFLDGVTFDGEVLGLPNGQLLASRYVISVRGDWVKKLEMGNIETLDDFASYLDKVKNTDLNGNGANDEIPLFTGGWATGSGQYELTTWNQIFLQHGGNSWIDDNGNYNISILDPNYKLMLQTLQDWYKKGYMLKEAYTADPGVLREYQPKNLFGAFGFWWSEGLSVMMDLRKTIPEAENVVILPKGPGKNELLQPQRIYGLACVTSKCKYPEKAVSLFNLLLTKEAQQVYTYGIEGVHWQYADADKTLVNLMGVIGNDTSKAKYYGQYFGSIFGGLFGAPVNNAYSYEAANLVKAIGTLPASPMLGRSFSYNDEGWNSKKTQNDRDTFIKENQIKILMGQMSVDKWDDIIKEWRAMGGDEYLKEIGDAYKKMSEETGKK